MIAVFNNQLTEFLNIEHCELFEASSSSGLLWPLCSVALPDPIHLPEHPLSCLPPSHPAHLARPQPQRQEEKWGYLL